MSKRSLATVWLDGCSGCHMSLLDLDEGILTLAQEFSLVYSPLVDAREFPENVDVTLVEGAVSSHDDLAKLRTIRARTRVLIALGDCAITGNVPSLRNPIPVERILQRVYRDGADANPGAPVSSVPELLAQARPLHDFVKVDAHLPGCPASPKTIWDAIGELLQERMPRAAGVKFG